MTSYPAIAYKILTGEQMAAFLADGQFAGAPVDIADGYIHLSTAGQLSETVNKHFAGQVGLHIAAIDLAACGEAVRWERSRGGALFPHIYADLMLSAVVAHAPLDRTTSGAIRLPAS